MPNRMLAAIAYTLGCFVAASVLTFLLVVFRPVKARDEIRSWRILLVMFGVCFLGPYAYNETLTRLFGPQLEKAVLAGYMDVPIHGPVRYYKVTAVKKDSAKVLVVANEAQDWGGDDTPLISLDLRKEGKNWRTTSYKILTSERLNRETYVFPVYW